MSWLNYLSFGYLGAETSDLAPVGPQESQNDVNEDTPTVCDTVAKEDDVNSKKDIIDRSVDLPDRPETPSLPSPPNILHAETYAMFVPRAIIVQPDISNMLDRYHQDEQIAQQEHCVDSDDGSDYDYDISFDFSDYSPSMLSHDVSEDPDATETESSSDLEDYDSPSCETESSSLPETKSRYKTAKKMVRNNIYPDDSLCETLTSRDFAILASIAISSGHSKLAVELISNRCNIHDIRAFDRYPLVIAAKKGDEEALTAILNLGANEEDMSKKLLLHAIQSRKFHMVRTIVEYHIRNKNYISYATYAISYMIHHKKTRYLRRIFSEEEVREIVMSKLYIDSIFANDKSVIWALYIRFNLDLNFLGQSAHHSFLCLAAMHGKLEVFDALMQMGYPQDYLYRKDCELIRHAVSGGNVDIVKLALKDKDVNEVLNTNHLYIALVEGKMNMVNYLISNGLEVSHLEDEYDIILTENIATGNVEIVEYMLENNIDPLYVFTQYNMTNIAHRNDVAMFNLFVKCGFNSEYAIHTLFLQNVLHFSKKPLVKKVLELNFDTRVFIDDNYRLFRIAYDNPHAIRCILDKYQ